MREVISQYASPIDDSLKQFKNHLLTADLEAMRNLGPNRHSVDPTHFHNVLDKLRGDNWRDVVPHMAPILEKLI